MKVHFRQNQSLLCPFLALQHISMVGSVPEKQRIIVDNIIQSREQMMKLINALLGTLNSHDRRGFVDSFLIRKQNDEVCNFSMIPFTVIIKIFRGQMKISSLHKI